MEAGPAATAAVRALLLLVAAIDEVLLMAFLPDLAIAVDTGSGVGEEGTDVSVG